MGARARDRQLLSAGWPFYTCMERSTSDRNLKANPEHCSYPTEGEGLAKPDLACSNLYLDNLQLPRSAYESAISDPSKLDQDLYMTRMTWDRESPGHGGQKGENVGALGAVKVGAVHPGREQGERAPAGAECAHTRVVQYHKKSESQ